nr:MAG TPA: hypothetical protein [Caudoviricetes sp.]
MFLYGAESYENSPIFVCFRCNDDFYIAEL